MNICNYVLTKVIKWSIFRWSQLQAEAVQDINDRGTWRLTILPTCMLGQIQMPLPTDLPIVTAMEAVVPEQEAPFQAEVPQGITMPWVIQYLITQFRRRVSIGPFKGTIHILLKHFYSSKFNLTSKLFTKTGCFFRQIKRISFSTIHFDEIFML